MKVVDESTLCKMAKAEFELDSNWERNSNANLQILMARVNSDPELP
jgi:hypothetical protein